MEESVREMMQQGMSRNEMADRLGVRPNKLNWTIKRVREQEAEPKQEQDTLDREYILKRRHDGHHLRMDDSPASRRILADRSEKIRHDMKFQDFLRIERPRLQHVLHEFDDRKLIQEPINTDIGIELREMTESGAKIHDIRKRFRQLKRE